jgi:integrase
MAQRYKLKANQIGKAKKPGMLNDGGGLYLSTSKSLSQSWIFRYRKQGKLRDIGLGSTRDIGLADARELADIARKAVKDDKDPRVALRGESGAVSFKMASKEYIDAHAPGWRNAKHKQQWENTLANYAFPVIGDVSVAAITTAHVEEILRPIWHDKNETAYRVQGRIESVLSFATAKKYREGFNPAVWRGNLEYLFTPRKKVHKVIHLSSLPYDELPALYAHLATVDAIGAHALRYTILTACRSGQTRHATWDEIDGDIWTVPGERMKSGLTHRIPLSAPVLAILDNLDDSQPYLFPGAKIDRPISDMTMTKLLKSRHPGITTHGMRATFRTWSQDKTSYPEEVCELSLAHINDDKTRAAYARSELIDQRRDLMNDWAAFVTGGLPDE